MLRKLRNFFIFSILLMFVYNLSGLSICLEHSQHSKNISAKAKHSKTEKRSSISQDDECQCALHLQMNHVTLTQPLTIDFTNSDCMSHELPHTKAIAYHCMLDYFSSRAPPSFT